MKITRTSPFSGKELTLELDITEEQVLQYTFTDRPIQDIFPNLTADEREFIKTGIHPGEF